MQLLDLEIERETRGTRVGHHVLRKKKNKGPYLKLGIHKMQLTMKRLRLKENRNVDNREH